MSDLDPDDYRLAYSCLYGDLWSIQQIVDKSFFGNIFWPYAMGFACQGGKMPAVELILKLSKNDGAIDWNWCLDRACFSGNVQIVKLTIEMGGRQFNDGLEGAYENRQWEMVKMMIEMGAKKQVEKIDDSLDIGLSMSLVGHYSYIDSLLQERKSRKESINSSLSFYLIDDLVGVVCGYSLWAM